MKKKNVKKILLAMITLCVVILAPLNSFAMSVNDNGIVEYENASFESQKGTTLVMSEQEVDVHSGISEILNTENQNDYFNIVYTYMHDTIPRIYYGAISPQWTYTAHFYGTPTATTNTDISSCSLNIYFSSTNTITYDAVVSCGLAIPYTYSSSTTSVKRLYAVCISVGYLGDLFDYRARVLLQKTDGSMVLVKLHYTDDEYSEFSSLDNVYMGASIENNSSYAILTSYACSKDENFRYNLDKGSYSTELLAAEQAYRTRCGQLGIFPSDLSNNLQNSYNSGFQAGKEVGYQEGLDAGYSAEEYEQGCNESYNNGYQYGYDKGLTANDEDVYNKGYADGTDHGVHIGQNQANNFLLAVDKIGDALFHSANIFTLHSGTIFGINLMQGICTIVALVLLWKYVKKVF